jgi:hypothetical protein
MTETFIPVHIERAGIVRVAAPLEQAFQFFTPDGERLWVPGWSPEYRHPPGGPQCEGAVFETNADGEHTLWMVTRYDPRAGVAEYVRVTPGSRLGAVSVRSVAETAQTTIVHVTYRLTALSPDGNRAVQSLAAGFDAMMAQWAALIAAV